MSAEVKTTEIEGLKITTLKLPPRKAMRIGVKLLKFALPAMAGANLDTEQELDEATLNGIGMRALAGMDEDEIDDLLCKLLVGTTVIRKDGKGEPTKFELQDPDMIDQAFAGKFGAMLACAKFVMGFNFAGYFTEGTAKPPAHGAAGPDS